MTAKVFAAGLVALVAFGCSDPPTTATALGDEAVAPAFMADRAEYSFPYDLQDEDPFLVCRGELVEGYGILTIHIREVTTPSGNLLVRGWVEYPGDSYMIGTESGVVLDLQERTQSLYRDLQGPVLSSELDDYRVVYESGPWAASGPLVGRL